MHKFIKHLFTLYILFHVPLLFPNWLNLLFENFWILLTCAVSKRHVVGEWLIVYERLKNGREENGVERGTETDRNKGNGEHDERDGRDEERDVETEVDRES